MILPVVGISVWGIVKIFILIFLAIYIVFAFVIVRQTQLMTDTLEIGFEKPLKFLSVMHFLFSIAVFVFAFIIL